MPARWLRMCTALGLASTLAFGQAPQPEAKRSGDADQASMLSPGQATQSRHEIETGAGRLPYTATAAVLPVRVDAGQSNCTVFYVSYVADAPSRGQRPLTFVFNGGPGAASAYLHLGALGPRRVLLQEASADRPAPLTDNRYSWLAFTDLVFIDPIGTGYSRCGEPKDDEGQQKQSGRRTSSEAGAWDVREDLVVLSRFIRLYLTRNERWASPKFLAGESYGGFRVAALTNLLQLDTGIALAGVVLVSPALDFGVLRGSDISLLPWVVRMPSYAATARLHGKSEGDAQPTRAAVQDVERFALTRMLPALATGETASIAGAVAAYTGLPDARVAGLSARIPVGVFARELLRDKGRILSFYDGGFTAIDPDPLSPTLPSEDPLLTWVNLRLTAGFNRYVREELKFDTDLPYEMLNARVARQWSWRSGVEGSQGYAEVASDLKAGMSWNPQLKVLLAHGLYDLVTPYLGSVVVLRQLALDPQVAGNLTLRVYPGGHMFYIDDAARQRFFEDARAFFAAALPDERSR